MNEALENSEQILRLHDERKRRREIEGLSELEREELELLEIIKRIAREM